MKKVLNKKIGINDIDKLQIIYLKKRKIENF